MVQFLLPLVSTRHWSAGKRQDFKGSSSSTSVLPLFLQMTLSFTKQILSLETIANCIVEINLYTNDQNGHFITAIHIYLKMVVIYY